MSECLTKKRKRQSEDGDEDMSSSSSSSSDTDHDQKTSSVTRSSVSQSQPITFDHDWVKERKIALTNFMKTEIISLTVVLIDVIADYCHGWVWIVNDNWGELGSPVLLDPLNVGIGSSRSSIHLIPTTLTESRLSLARGMERFAFTYWSKDIPQWLCDIRDTEPEYFEESNFRLARWKTEFDSDSPNASRVGRLPSPMLYPFRNCPKHLFLCWPNCDQLYFQDDYPHTIHGDSNENEACPAYLFDMYCISLASYGSNESSQYNHLYQHSWLHDLPLNKIIQTAQKESPTSFLKLNVQFPKNKKTRKKGSSFSTQYLFTIVEYSGWDLCASKWFFQFPRDGKYLVTVSDIEYLDDTTIIHPPRRHVILDVDSVLESVDSSLLTVVLIHMQSSVILDVSNHLVMRAIIHADRDDMLDVKSFSLLITNLTV